MNVWNVYGSDVSSVAYEGDIILIQGEQVTPSFRYPYRYDERRQIVIGEDGWSSIWDAYYAVGYGLTNWCAHVAPLDFGPDYEQRKIKRSVRLWVVPLDMQWAQYV